MSILASDLRNKNTAELNQQLKDLLKQQLKLRINNSTGEMKQNHLFRQVRRDIARVKMVMSEIIKG